MADRLHHPNRVLALLCSLCACWAFSFGLEAPLASLWLRDAGYGLGLIGWNNAAYYLGLIVASACTPALMRRWGSWCPVVGLVASGLTVAGFPFAGSLPGYFALRVLNGAAGALALVPLESLVNHNAPQHRRARDFGCYALSVVLGMAAGELAGWHLYGDWPRLSFVLGGGVALLSASLVGLLPALRPDSSPEDWRAVSQGPATSWSAGASSGFLEAGLMHLLPLYLVFFGMTATDAGWLMSAVLVGVIVLQVPIGWAADRFGRQRVLLGCYGIVAVGLGVAVWCRDGWQLAAVLFVTGSFAGAFYPLGLAILGERVPPTSIPAANSAYLAINCLGSLISQPLTGALMEQQGPQAFFHVGQTAVLAALALSLLGWRWQRRRSHSRAGSAVARSS